MFSVIEEVLEHRRRASRRLQTRPLLAAKLALLVSSVVVPYTAPIETALAYTLATLAPLAALGLRRSLAYVASSAALVYLFTTLIAHVFGGDVAYVTRGVLVAVSTLSTSITVFVTTRPSVFRRLWPLYILVVLLGDVLREVRDIATVYRARGSGGLRYYLEVYTASLALSLRRAETLADSLRARGVEVAE